MGYMSAMAKAKNRMPKPNSKTQQKKKEEALKNPVEKIVCEKCQNGNTTLFNIKNHYYCKNCKEKGV